MFEVRGAARWCGRASFLLDMFILFSKAGAESNPFELAVQIVTREDQRGRAAVGTVVAVLGEVTLLDIKTSKGIYDEYRIQLAAYQEAWDELNPKTPIEKVVVLHLDKETYQLTAHPFGDLSNEWEMFKHLRALYVLQKKKDPKRNGAQSTGYRRAGLQAAKKDES